MKVRSNIHTKGYAMVATTVLIAVTFSGCVQFPWQEPAEKDDSGNEPEWSTGHWWRYRIEGALPASWMAAAPTDSLEGTTALGDRDPLFTIESNSTLVASSADHRYRVLAEDPDVWFFNWLGLPLAGDWDVSSGRFGHQVDADRPHYSGRDSPFHPAGTRFFDWPLEDGKEWSTWFMGAFLEVTTTLTNGTYTMEARQGNEPRLVYEYDPDAKWFRSLDVLDGERGTVLTVRLDSRGHEGFEGTVYGSTAWGTDKCSGSLTCSSDALAFEEGKTIMRLAAAYEGLGEGRLIATYEPPDKVLPEAWFEETCPCQGMVTLKKSPEEAGDHVWRIQMLATETPLHVEMIALRRCFDSYEFDGDNIESLVGCKRPSDELPIPENVRISPHGLNPGREYLR